MKNVMFAVTTLCGGGAERVVTLWANALIKSGYNVSVLVYGRVENEYLLDDRIQVYTIAETYEAYKQMSYFQRLAKMRQIVKLNRAKTIISFLPRMQIWMMFATFGLNVYRIETVRVSPWVICRNSKVEKLLWKLCIYRADKIIIQTSEQSDYFSKNVRKKCVVISNPVSEKYLNNYKKEIDGEIKKFVATGRITPQKNYPLMIEGFAKVCEKNPDIKLYIYGTGDENYISFIYGLINKYNMQNNIFLMGRTTDIEKVYISMDAFLLTSDFEGLPNGLIEAMVTKLVSISTDCKTGPKDLIEDGKNGFLVPVGDVNCLVEAIEKVVSLDIHDHEMIVNFAREKILHHCSEEQSIQKLKYLLSR